MKKSNQFTEAKSPDNLRHHLSNLTSSFESVIKESVGFLYSKEDDKLFFIYRHEEKYHLVYTVNPTPSSIIILRGRKYHTFYLFTKEDRWMQPEALIMKMTSIIETGNRNLLQRVVARLFNL